MIRFICDLNNTQSVNDMLMRASGLTLLYPFYRKK